MKTPIPFAALVNQEAEEPVWRPVSRSQLYRLIEDVDRAPLHGKANASVSRSTIERLFLMHMGTSAQSMVLFKWILKQYKSLVPDDLKENDSVMDADWFGRALYGALCNAPCEFKREVSLSMGQRQNISHFLAKCDQRTYFGRRLNYKDILDLMTEYLRGMVLGSASTEARLLTDTVLAIYDEHFPPNRSRSWNIAKICEALTNQ